MNVLIIDNDDLTAEAVLSSTHGFDCKIESVRRGKDALKKMEQNNFDLVLIDIFLPDIKGYELIPLLKKKDPDISIVTLTEVNTRELEARVRKEGILYYMTKPFKGEIFKDILNHIYKHKEKSNIEKRKKLYNEWSKL